MTEVLDLSDREEPREPVVEDTAKDIAYDAQTCCVLLPGEIESRIRTLIDREKREQARRVRPLLESALCLLAEGPEVMRSVALREAVERDVRKALDLLDPSGHGLERENNNMLRNTPSQIFFKSKSGTSEEGR